MEILNSPSDALRHHMQLVMIRQRAEAAIRNAVDLDYLDAAAIRMNAKGIGPVRAYRPPARQSTSIASVAVATPAKVESRLRKMAAHLSERLAAR